MTLAAAGVLLGRLRLQLLVEWVTPEEASEPLPVLEPLVELEVEPDDDIAVGFR